MIFNSLHFILFLIIVVSLYWVVHKRSLQNLLLLGASYYFYAVWDWRFLSLIIISTLVDFVVGWQLEKTDQPLHRRGLLLISLAVNLGILGYFKYYNFFIDSFVDILSALGVQANPSSLAIILPVGISFYTFQTLSYTIDIYRGELQATHNLLDFALFVSFFPQLVAGPIERASNLLPQIAKDRHISPEIFESGLVMILIGMFKKIAIADVAAGYIDPLAFTNPSVVDNGVVLQAVYLFAIQIYADFAAYSLIARGCARLLGIELMENFRQPYIAQSVSEFWRRWHISLSTWFRDYVYIPTNNWLRRYIKNEFAIYSLAVLVTMFLSGLWHGANYTFIIWGVLLGVFQILHRPFRGIVPNTIKENHLFSTLLTIGRVLLTFHLVLMAWVFFRTPSVMFIPEIYLELFRDYTGGVWLNLPNILFPLLLVYGLSFTIDACQITLNEQVFTLKLNRVGRVLVYASLLLIINIYVLKPYVPFIYFQF